MQEVPQGFVLRSILFDIYLNNSFFQLNDIDICNFADDTTACVCDFNLESVIESLKENSELAITWFERNYMKLNTDCFWNKI